MPGIDLDLTLPALDQSMATNIARIATALSAIEDDLAALVTAGELDINTSLSFNGNPATNVGGVRLAGGESDVAGTVYTDAAYDLWVTTSAGAVKLTQDGAINAAGIGGIGGDYGTGDESASYDTASQEYRFMADGTTWADLVADDLVLKGSAGSLRLGVDSGLSGTKTALWKSLPASGVSLLAYKASTQTIEDAATVTISNALAVTDLTAAGDVAVTGSFSAAGQRVRHIPPSAAIVGNTSTNTSWQLYDTGTSWTIQYGTNAAGSLFYPLDLDQGDTLDAWQLRVNKTSNGSTTLSAGLYRQSAWGALELVGSLYQSSAVNPGNITFGPSSGLALELAAGYRYVIKVNSNNLATTDGVFGVDITYSIGEGTA